MLSIGLDVSKGYTNVGILNEEGIQLRETFLIDDTYEGHKKFEEIIECASKINKGDTIKIGMESTGGYEINFFNFCNKIKEKYNLSVYRLNPLSVRKFIETDLHRAKNDDMNAIDIARYLIEKKDIKPTKELNKEMEGLKEIIKTIERFTKESAKIKNIIQMNIQRYFPELLQYCRNGISEWILELLYKYPTVYDIKEGKIEEIMKIPYISESKAQKIVELARYSIANQADVLYKISIKQNCKAIIQHEENIAEMKKELIKEYRKISLNKLSTIFGIGEYTASVLTAFTGSIDNFDNDKKYIAFFGLDPRISDSGDEVKKRKITKKGNHIVRKNLYMSVLSCLTNKEHPVSRMYYRLINRGVHHYSAVTACMKKLLSISFGILKSGKDFDINYEDRKKSDEMSIKSIEKKVLRIKKNESLNLDAPISKKEMIRRKKIAAMS